MRKTIIPSYLSKFIPVGSLCLLVLSGCGYQRPDGQWLPLEASAIKLTAVKLEAKAIDPNYASTCKEARDELDTQLRKKLPGKIAPLASLSGETSAARSADTAILEVLITGCNIDVDQSGGTFNYYLTLPVRVRLTLNEKTLLNYRMDTYEQISVDAPGPEFAFTFAEPVERTLLLFDGERLWLPDH